MGRRTFTTRITFTVVGFLILLNSFDIDRLGAPRSVNWSFTKSKENQFLIPDLSYENLTQYFTVSMHLVYRS